MEISKKLKETRPELSDSTLKTYTSILKSIHKRVFGDEVKFKNFEKWQDIIEDFKDKPVSSRKTALSALYVLTGIQKYNELMREGIEEYKNGVDKLEMNEKQKDAFKTQEEIKDIVEQYKKRAELLYKKNGRTVRDVQDIQDFIILVLTSGVYIPPRRAEWTKFKIKDIDVANDNYIKDGKQFVFNTFKTSKQKGTQLLDIPSDLKKIIKKWLLINPTPYLLFDVKGDALNATKLNQRLGKIFGKGFSVNGLRHSYLSSKYQDTIKLNEEMAEDFEAMGSSIQQKNVYLKKLD
jgi:hypothetical protein